MIPTNRFVLRSFAAALSVVAVIGVAACGSDDSDDADETTSSVPAATDDTAPDTPATITVSGSTFAPTAATAAAGEITVVNEDGFSHTFTEGTPDSPGDAFDEALDPSGTVTVTLAAGTYEFYCKIHTSMTGTLTVS